MNFKIRPYKNSDFKEIHSWWASYQGATPTENMLMENGTFILELNNIPCFCLSVLLTQSKDICYLQGFIKNPAFKHINLQEYGKMIWDYCCDYAKNKGYTRIICFGPNEKLTKKYQDFGMIKTFDNLSSLVRIL